MGCKPKERICEASLFQQVHILCQGYVLDGSGLSHVCTWKWASWNLACEYELIFSPFRAGVRHVKVWKLPDDRSMSPSRSRLIADSSSSPAVPPPKTLTGRNCLLGPLNNEVFTCVASISDTEAVVGTDSGLLCLLNDGEGNQNLSLVKRMNFGITSLAVDSDREAVWMGGRGGQMNRFTFKDLRTFSTPGSSSPVATDKSSKTSDESSITSMGFLSSQLVMVDARRAIRLYPIDNLYDDDHQNRAGTLLPAHRDAVLGIRPLRMPNSLGAEFFTWSSGGAINFWDANGRYYGSQKVELDQLPCGEDDIPNELKVVCATEDMSIFVSGDRLGVLRFALPSPDLIKTVLANKFISFFRVICGKNWQCIQEVRAHGGEITDIAIQQIGVTALIATCGRDRVVQLFRKDDDNVELVQTMGDHVGAVAQLLFIDGGQKLLSCSADRTVLVREQMVREEEGGSSTFAYVISRVITSKSSPVSMALMPNYSDILVFSTVDRCIQKYNLSTGRHISSFRASDYETSDAVVMSSLTMSAGIPGHSPALLVGVSTTDKSIRTYDIERETLLTGEFGHTEGISALYLVDDQPSADSDKRLLVSAGIDGVIMMWDLSVQLQQSQQQEDEASPIAKEVAAAKPPLRRVLSKVELASFQRTDSNQSMPPPSAFPAIQESRQSMTPSQLRNRNTLPTPPPFIYRRRSSGSSAADPPSPLSPKTSRRHAPPSPKAANCTTRPRRLSGELLKSRTNSIEANRRESLHASTEQACKSLKAYREMLYSSTTEEIPSPKEVERELNLTLRVLATHAKGNTSPVSSRKESVEDARGLMVRQSLSENKKPRSPRRIPSISDLGKMKARRFSRSRSTGRDS